MHLIRPLVIFSLCTLLSPFVCSTVAYVLIGIFVPQVLGDGQFALLFLWFMPFEVLLGVLCGAVIAFKRMRHPLGIGICILMFLGSCLLPACSAWMFSHALAFAPLLHPVMWTMIPIDIASNSFARIPEPVLALFLLASGGILLVLVLLRRARSIARVEQSAE